VPAANDGADADSKIAAVAKSLIFITVLVVLLIAIISFPVSVRNATPAAGSFNCDVNPIHRALYRVNQVRVAPTTLAMVITVMAFQSAAR